MLSKARFLVPVFFLCGAIFACSSGTGSSPPSATAGTTKDGGGTASKSDGGTVKTASKPKTKPSMPKLTSLAGATAPAGAKSQGKKSSPSAGGTTVPVNDAEVYLVLIDFDGDSSEDQLYWAHVDGVTYLWAEGPVECEDGLTDGTGGFVAVVNEDGSGSYMFAVDECPTQNLFGCDFDAEGVETVCGACAWNEAAIACVAAE
jgi:hypothetical protein